MPGRNRTRQILNHMETFLFPVTKQNKMAGYSEAVGPVKYSK